jgi:hypothetical protein
MRQQVRITAQTPRVDGRPLACHPLNAVMHLIREDERGGAGGNVPLGHVPEQRKGHAL